MEVQSAWTRNPDYRIDLVPVAGTARVWFGDLLLADSAACIELHEERHVPRLYFPEADVRWEHLTLAEGMHTACPWKGVADYWDLTAVEPVERSIAWSYRHPFDEVADIAGRVAFYDDRTRVDVAS